MDPKMVAEALTKISQQYEASCKDRAAMEAVLESRAQAILTQQKTIAARDREIEELKKQRDADLPRLAREIDGWKAKYKTVFDELSTAKADILSLGEELNDSDAKLESEKARADALALKYDPQIQAELAAKAEAERLRQIAELEAKLKALKKD